MGLLLSDGINDFLKEAACGKCSGKSLLMLGKQVIYIDAVQMFILAKRLKIELLSEVEIIENENGHIDSNCFFKLLGFENVESMDISDYENADIIFDLNGGDAPVELKNKYDYIVDGGTLEHIFNIPNALKNISEMLKPGGKVYHYVPAVDYINHGYYSVSPSLFIDFYNNQKFFIHDINIILGSENFYKNILDNKLPEELEDCLSTCVDYRLCNLRDGRFPLLKKYTGIVKCIAQKPVSELFDKEVVDRHWYDGKKEGFDAIISRYKLEKLSDASIGIWGCGDIGTSFYNNFPSKNKIGCYIVGDKKTAEECNGIKIISCDEIKEMNLQVIIIASTKFEGEIWNQIKEMNLDGIKVIKMKKYL